jgi:hypothetical protein
MCEGQRSQPRTNSTGLAQPPRRRRGIERTAGGRADGVNADGMAGSDTGITREACFGGEQSPTGVASPEKGEGQRVGTGVGAADSSVDLWDTTTDNPRGAKRQCF